MTDKPIEYINGWVAHMKGRSSEENPYCESTEAKSNSLWYNGWYDRFYSVKHEEDLTFDKEWEE
jgi:ribosome modulation factor